MGILPMIWTRDRITCYSIALPNTHCTTKIISVRWMLKSVNSAASKPEPLCPVVSLPFFSLDPRQDLKKREKYVSMCSKHSTMSQNYKI